MIAAKYLFGLILALPATALMPSSAQADDPPLGAYNADIGESSISGISSGAFMAVQFATAWSDIIKGVGIIAGGPYYCAQATAVGGFIGDIGGIPTVTGPCVGRTASCSRAAHQADRRVGSQRGYRRHAPHRRSKDLCLRRL